MDFFVFVPIKFLKKWSLQNFAHDTTAALLWHVQNFVVIWLAVTELQQC